MVNTYGQWTPETDYNFYPKGQWCDMDRLTNYIRNQKYTPNTSLENLALMIIERFQTAVEDGDVPSDALYGAAGIQMDIVREIVRNAGGLKEFDYWC